MMSTLVHLNHKHFVLRQILSEWNQFCHERGKLLRRQKLCWIAWVNFCQQNKNDQHMIVLVEKKIKMLKRQRTFMKWCRRSVERLLLHSHKMSQFSAPGTRCRYVHIANALMGRVSQMVFNICWEKVRSEMKD
mmetsp:Transcript_7685/g.11469  ORF Transcript_7685/g.11469 Transcript_7685/m.11469 type:complete len:133 (+) Transcript_7685:706-1104(+)